MAHSTSQRSPRGAALPAFLYGTAWKEEGTGALTELALGAGFRGIDTANQRKHYYEAAVGKAVSAAMARGQLTRDALFLQTKFTFKEGQDQRLPYDPRAPIAEQVTQSFSSSLEHLQTDYLDSYLLHGPTWSSGLHAHDWEAWRAMESLVASGRVKWIGVSNVSLEQLSALHARAEIKPAFVQNRCYARTGWDREVREFCAANDIVYQGFSLLTANRRELASPAVVALAEQRQRSVSELVFRFALALGILPLTGTSKLLHMQLDLASAALELSSAEVDVLLNAGR